MYPYTFNDCGVCQHTREDQHMLLLHEYIWTISKLHLLRHLPVKCKKEYTIEMEFANEVQLDGLAHQLPIMQTLKTTRAYPWLTLTDANQMKTNDVSY